MGNHASNRSSSFDFLDRLVNLFHQPSAEVRSPPPSSEGPLKAVSEQFETALTNLEKIIQSRQESENNGSADWARRLPKEDEEEKKAREQKIHHRIRQDIESAHSRLGTGVSSDDLDRIRDFLDRAAAVSSEGAQSHEVLSRCRHSILKRIHFEAGILALKQLDEVLRQHGEAWPETVPRDPSISVEKAREVQRRKETERRQDFLNYSIRRSALLLVGVVEGWKSDYPEAESPLWQSVVLEAVATGVRGRLMQRFSDRLQEDRALIESRAAELIGAELTELNQTLLGGLTSLTDAHRVVASSMKILDDIIPALAWEHLQEIFPEARRETR